MSNKKSNKNISLSYTISRKEIIRIYLKRFYKNKYTVIIAFSIFILGVFISNYKNFIGSFIINLGILMIIFPFIMILFNLRKITASSWNLKLKDECILMNNGSTSNSIEYKFIEEILEDEYYIIIKPNNNGMKCFKKVVIPVKNICNGDKNQFIINLKEKIQS